MKTLVGILLFLAGMLTPSILYFALNDVPPSPYLRVADGPMEGEPLTPVHSTDNAPSR